MWVFTKGLYINVIELWSAYGGNCILYALQDLLLLTISVIKCITALSSTQNVDSQKKENESFECIHMFHMKL